MTPNSIPLTIIIALGVCLPALGCSGDKAGADGKTTDAKAAADGGDASPATPEAATSKQIVAIDVASLSTCALLEGGTVRCWGGNVEGQLGIGKTGDELLESYTPVDVPGISGVAKLWASGSYSWGGGHSDGTTDTVCVQMPDGAVKCWGHNGLVFGDGEYKNQPAPTDIAALASITELDSASGFACGVWPDKTAKCWGTNAFGVLGIGNDEREAKTPTAVKDFTGAVDVGTGQNHSCGLKDDGTVWCWGYGGMLGDGTSNKSNAPVQVKDLTDATQLAVFASGSCALKKDATVTCWGSDFGNAPKLVEGATDITAIDAEGFTCGLKTDKTVVCWGANSYGQLGDGDTKDRKTKAAPVKGLANVKEVKVGATHACALLEDNSVKCWGKNGRGQLGDGTIDDRSEPVTALQVAALTLTPQADADRPKALPADDTVAVLSGPPEGCKNELSAKVKGAAIPFTVRHVTAEWNYGEHGIKLSFLNYDTDELNKWAMPRGAQARIAFNLEKWVIEKNDKGDEVPVQKPVDAEGEFTTKMLDNYRLTGNTGIYDNHKQRFMDTGSVKVTHLDDSWVCGEINLSHADEKHALTGTFAAPLPAKKAAE